ncbi:Retrovirus-related Pol polyprotein from type-1 retrotransposable element R1 [Araneus ventricosus]|uniref:Retrovirus-related Pol polyprotein from type-1 retrotransposable element R1 n=1 Tax=Araneus ventricosus TaxID=182803 RepID=A0A4Y2B3P9_ARAVE|nr:Retrovirus-related Pol polyprotein from type-1 retrotransposable element R1 [Araneus ventricosus]
MVFRKGRSTEDALMRIELFIETAKESEMVSCMIALDLQNAFNSIHWNQTKLLIHRNRVPRKIARVIDSFLRDRHMLSEGQKWKYNIGVPQGSSLGPILWLLVINEALDLRETENVLIQAYEDDIIIMLRSTASYHFTGMSENILKHLEMWANTYNLTFSKNKTKYLMFKYKKVITHFPCIYLYGGRIGYDKNIKYLGIIFDTNLSLMPHLNAIQSKVMKLHEKIRRITRVSWGLNAEVRTPLIGITKTYSTVSNEALQVLAGCPPLDIKIAEEIEVLTRIKQVRREQEIGGLISFDYELKIKPWQLIRIIWEFFEEHENGHLIFTDGSKIGDKVGCAFVHYYDKMELQFQQYRVGVANTICMAEVTAIQKAIDYVIASGLVNMGIVHSRSTLQTLESVVNRKVIIVDIKTKLQTYRNDILLYWVKAHKGQWGNERFLARSAAEKDVIDVEFFQSAGQLRNTSNQNIRENWQARWSNSRKRIWTRTFYEKVDTKRICGDFYFNQVLTSHGVFGSFQASMASQLNVNVDKILNLYPM